MKKILLTLASLICLSTFSQAQMYIGAEIASNTLNSSIEDTGGKYAFKFGTQSSNWRTGFALKYFESGDSELDEYQGTVNFDYIFTDETSMFRPFIGGSVGYTIIDYDYHFSEDSITIGGEAGILFNVDPSVNIELGARYTWYNGDTINRFYPDFYDVFDDSYEVYIGINFKFPSVY